MTKIESVRERYHYGTKHARLYRDIAIDKPTATWRSRLLLDVLLFSLFFNSHRTYRDRLAATRPKGHVYLPDFRELMNDLLVEWSDSNLLATVFLSYVPLSSAQLSSVPVHWQQPASFLLIYMCTHAQIVCHSFHSANAAFLAVPVRPGVIDSSKNENKQKRHADPPTPPPQNIAALPQTASLCSMLFSMLSLVIGVHHVWRHRRRANATEHEAVRAFPPSILPPPSLITPPNPNPIT